MIVEPKKKRGLFSKKKKRSDEPRYIKPNTIHEYKPPMLFVVAYIGCIAMGGFGDWGRLAGGIGTYMKGASLLAVAIAGLTFLQTGRFTRLKEIGILSILFVFPILFTLALSLIIWACNAEPLWAISRGAQKLIFQVINIASVVSAIYIFGKDTLQYCFFGLVIANTAIILLQAAQAGVGGTIQSILDCYLRGNTYGFMKSIEIHDITYCMGLYFLYFLCVESKKKPICRLYALIAFMLFFIGFKRVAILSIILCIGLWFLMVRMKPRTRRRLIYTVSTTIVFAVFAYVLFIKNGLFQTVTDMLHIDTAGRSKIYSYIDRFYTVDVTYMGYGFEYTVAMLRGMRDAGTQEIAVTGIHNDIMKQYIELGFWGFWVWSIFTYLFQARWYMRRYGEIVSRLMLMLNIYTVVTYLTDNTTYYFWLTMTMRVMMASFSFKDEIIAQLNEESHQSGHITMNDAVQFVEGEHSE